jgi:probable phosphoglycerate mutase
MTGNLFASPDSSTPWFTAHCDGGSRGNPGPSGYGAIVEDAQGHTVARLGEFLGIQTNNYAEYSGLIAVLNWAIENRVSHMRVVSDSELMVKQMKGQYSVKSPVLLPLYQQARALSRKLDGFEMRHTLRGGNKEADRLANEAMDKGMGRTPASQSAEALARRVSDAPLTPAGKSSSSSASKPTLRVPPVPILGSGNPPAPKPARQVLEGYVKDGVVHLLEGQLPDGIFVKVIRE